MNFKNVLTRNIKLEKLMARYQPWKTSHPPKFGAPNNPWDNLDPGRMDKGLIDEFDK
jgi:hypothetical protein